MKHVLHQHSDAKTIAQLRAQGYKAVDLHVHTSNSYDVPEVETLHQEALYKKAESLGMDFITFTDHDNIDAHNTSLGDKHVRGVELTVNDPFIGYEIHINIYQLSEDNFDWLQEHNNDIKAILEYCNKNDLPHVYNHPFTFETKDYTQILRHPRQTIRSIKWLAEHIHVIEVNHSRPKMFTRLVFPLANHYDNAVITATDTHTGQVATAYTLAQGNTFDEWFANVKAGKAKLVHALSTDTYFDYEAYNYMENVLKPQKKVIRPITNNAVANALIRFSNQYKKLARYITPILRPIVALVTRSGLARIWYQYTQKTIARQLEIYVDKLKSAKRLKRISRLQ
jgi:predicted metal-dependent phosphoesterase TrpH